MSSIKNEPKNKKQESGTLREGLVLTGRLVKKDRTVEPVELHRGADGHWYTPDGREAVVIARIGEAEGEVR